MAFPSQQEIDIIATQILFDTKQALLSLKAWNNSIQDGATKVKLFKELIRSTAQQMNGDLKAATSSVAKFASAMNINPAVIRNVAKELKDVGANAVGAGNSGKEAGDKMSSAFHRTLSPVNALRIALGAIVSIIVFQVIQAFAKMVQGALKGLTEIESAMFNVVNAEKRLSEQGIDATVEGFEKLIKDLQVLNPMLSKFQATELVSSLATKVAPALGLGQKQVESLARSIAVLAVRNQALGKSFEEVETQVITGLLSGRVTSGINQLGLKITDQRVEEEALRLKLVGTTEAYKELNAQEKERIDALAIISILEQNTAEEAESLPAFLKTASGLISVAKAEFQDLLTSLGQKFAPVLKTIFQGLISILERINKSLIENEDAWNALVTFVTVGAKAVIMLTEAFIKLSLRIGEAGAALYKFLGALPVIGTLVGKLFPKSIYPDTPTGPPSDRGRAAEDEKKKAEALKKAEEQITDIMRDARDKRLDIERDYQRKLEDINTDYSNKLSDIARNTSQKREDALRNYNQKVEDINRDTAQKIAEAQQDARQKELDREKEFQQRLKELREKFLFDLEDALRERDARQVLRLIREYQRDKQNLIDRRKLDTQEAKADLQQKIANLELERKLKLEAAKREYEERLQEIAIAQQRELEEARIWRQRQLQDARIWHQRQLAEQREYLQRKLRDLADALMQEFKLSEAAAKAIVSMMAAAFSAGTSTLSASRTGSTSYSGSTTSGGSQYVSPYPGAPYMTLANPYYAKAEGGTIIADKPTSVLFGEKGLEAATFTPLNRTGQDVNKVFGDVGALGGAGGSLSLRILLSDGLIADVVNASLDRVAAVIETVQREK